MKRIYPLFILVLFIFLSNLGEVFAVEVACPPSKKTEATPDDIHGKIKQCVEARKKRNEASLNTSWSDFYCPSGNFSIQDNQAINDWRIAMQIGISVLFAAIDYDAMVKICELRESRISDIIQWQNEINTTFSSSESDEAKEDSSDKSILARYNKLCANGGVNIMNIVNANSEGKKWIDSTLSFPEWLCRERAKQKVKMWTNLSYILMNEGIAKWYQNDKDTFLDKIKTKYDVVREKFHALLEYIDKSTMNLTNLTKKTVQ